MEIDEQTPLGAAGPPLETLFWGHQPGAIRIPEPRRRSRSTAWSGSAAPS